MNGENLSNKYKPKKYFKQNFIKTDKHNFLLASQFEASNSCNRFWYYKKILNLAQISIHKWLFGSSTCIDLFEFKLVNRNNNPKHKRCRGCN